MTATTPPLSERPAWKALQTHYGQIEPLHLRKLFADDPQPRRAAGARSRGHLPRLFQEPRHRRNAQAAVQLAEESGLRDRIDAMFRGEKINVTENRAVLHVALRAPKGSRSSSTAKNVVPEVHAVLDKMAAFADRVRSGEWKGHTGKRDPQRHQHRHRRLRPGARHGLRSAAALTATAT